QMIQERLKQETTHAQAWLQQQSETAIAAGIPTETQIQIGEPGRYVRDLAKEWQADLIIIGRRGLRGFQELFLGSVSNYVLHHAPCSVLVVQATPTSSEN
ncbi:MAG: universal stress protein, partial [Microcystaceae cyanobacterium]